jgi:hypothetical protein
MYILEGEAQVLLWVPRAGGQDSGDPLPAAWSEDSLAAEALHTSGSQACAQSPVQRCRPGLEMPALPGAHQNASCSVVQKPPCLQHL